MSYQFEDSRCALGKMLCAFARYIELAKAFHAKVRRRSKGAMFKSIHRRRAENSEVAQRMFANKKPPSPLAAGR